jgi:uncharacterized tellurite resistance protein B-like protein
MGLFDKVFGSSDPKTITLTTQEGFFGIMLLVVAADGDIAEGEMLAMYAITKRMKLYDGLSESQHTNLIKKTSGILKKFGPKVLLEKAAASLPPELKPTAFAISVDLVFADGVVEDEERAILELIYKQLAIPKELANKIIEIMKIKNAG